MSDDLPTNDPPTSDPPTNDPVDLARPFLEFWTMSIDQANAVTKTMLESGEASSDPKVWQREWFAAVGQSLDQSLRGPEFLQAMKQNMEALVQAKIEAGEASNAASTRHWEDFVHVAQVPQPGRRVDLGTVPYDVVFTDGPMKLLRYGRAEPARFAEPILVCFSLVNRPYILDLYEERSVIRQLLEGGFDVYLVDWGSVTDEEKSLQLDDYVRGYLKHAVDFACQQTSATRVHLLGYCMGGTMSAMFTALYPQTVRNLVLLAAPIDFGGEESLVNVWSKEEYFDVDRLIDAFGNCPGLLLQFCFQLMKPVANFVEKYVKYCDNLNDEVFVDNFQAMEHWSNDHVPVAGETFREFVKLFYQQNRLIQGDICLGGFPVKLEDITCPLLALVADYDHLVPVRSTLEIQKYARSSDFESLSIDTGHIGLAVSSKAHRKLWPVATKWLADHAARQTS